MNTQIEELLSDYPEDIVKLAKQTRECVLANATGAEEKVQMGWKVITYAYGKAFCAVAPHKNWVNLQLYVGAELSDPSELLEGSGKSMRHVKIRSSKDLNNATKSLIREAASLAG